MKAILKPAPHTAHPGDCVEVWFDGEMVAVIYGADGPGVRVVSKYIDETTTTVAMQSRTRGTPGLIEVHIKKENNVTKNKTTDPDGR